MMKVTNGNHRTRNLQCTLPQRGLPCRWCYFLKHEGFREDYYPSKGEARKQVTRPATPRTTSNPTADARRHSPQNRCGAEDQISAVGLFMNKRPPRNNADSSEQHGLLGTSRSPRNITVSLKQPGCSGIKRSPRHSAATSKQ